MTTPTKRGRFLLPLSLISLALAGCNSGGITSAATSLFSGGPEEVADKIKVNQVGYLPGGTKQAVVPAGKQSHFSVVNTTTNREVFRGQLTPAAHWGPSGESVQIADFTDLKAPGEYRLQVDGLKASVRFRIDSNIYQQLNAASIKSYYLNRNGIELLPEFAGEYARPLGHPDTHVLVHASAASEERPEGTVISSPKGWYDAGDYNKYIVNSGISTYTLLSAYEHFPQHYRQQSLNIPESTNNVPDLLDEVYWNLAWMLTMQDPADGGVYHKLTNKRFDGVIMPHEAVEPRYVVQKGTTAALNFAAVMATASRIFAGYDQQFPGLSRDMLIAAEKAWRWAVANPNVAYEQPDDIKTGAYGDKQFADEFAWAAAELYIATRNDNYYRTFVMSNPAIGVSSWSDVSGLPWISLAHHVDNLTPAADKNLIRQKVLAEARSLWSRSSESAYRLPMQNEDFKWGSNSFALNQAVMLLQGYRLSNEAAYLDVAQSLLDYTLGKNPLNVSYVTGFGERSPMHIHHRPSEADGIRAPIPGFISGGPNPGQQDADDCPVPYPFAEPAKSWLDHWCSYASNEIAINWNAPLVYVSGAIQVLTAE